MVPLLVLIFETSRGTTGSTTCKIASDSQNGNPDNQLLLFFNSFFLLGDKRRITGLVVILAYRKSRRHFTLKTPRKFYDSVIN